MLPHLCSTHAAASQTFVHTCSSRRLSCAWAAACQGTMQQTAHSTACQRSSACGQQHVSNMRAGHGMGACKHKCSTFWNLIAVFQEKPEPATHLLGTWAAERSAAPEVAARLPDRLLPLPGRESLLLPCQDGLTACCHCRCCRAVGRGVHALYVAASCCFLAWCTPAAVRALHSTPHAQFAQRDSPGQAGHSSCMPIADSLCFVTHLLGGWRAPVQHSTAGPARPWPLWVGICGVTEDPAAADVPPALL